MITAALALASALTLFAGGPVRGQVADADCLACHADPGLKRADGTSLLVEEKVAGASIHGQAGLACLDCHADLKAVKEFPHAEKLAPAACAACHAAAAAKVKASVHGAPREGPDAVVVSCKDCHGTHDIRGREDTASSVFAINIPDTCEACHLERVTTKRGRDFVRSYEQSIHSHALKQAGLSLSATCASCHGSHDVRPAGDPNARVARKAIIRTCGSCHAGIRRDYFEGVHGKDYLKGNTDVPVCTDCHSEHAIQSPQELGSLVYATRVAGVCSRCHDDERLARQYGFLTSRLKTFAASYHGTASTFGETRVANCASCHGVHDIRTSADPKSSIAPANLARTCGKCHPGAGLNFSKGKIHVVSEKTEAKGAFAAKAFYIAVIAGLITIFLLFIAVDLYRRGRNRWRHARKP